MVISKVGKRKRKAIPPPAKELRPAQKVPKRPKVQAQRKFAQICGGSATSSLLTPLNSSQPPQANTKVDGPNHDPPQELLPNHRPNTEDFLTFLCFRGTSVLPSHLDFFNTNKSVLEKQEIKKEEKQTAESCEASCSTKIPPEKSIKKDEKSAKLVVEKNDCSVEEVAKKSNIIPFAVRKRADTVAVGTRRQTVEALKKKYQEQRIAKNQVRCKTRSTTSKNAEPPKMKKTKECEKNEKIIKIDDSLNDSNIGKTKRRLRGNAFINNDKSETKAKPVVATKATKVLNDIATSEKNANNKVNTRATKQNTSVQKNKPSEEETVEQSTRTTRQKSISQPKSDVKVTISLNKSSKCEEPEEKKTRKGTKLEKTSSKSLAAEDFSSDDDRPLLATTADKKENKNSIQEKPQRKLKRNSNRKNAHDTSVDRKSEVSSKNSEPVAKRKTKSIDKVTVSASVTNKKSTIAGKKNASKCDEKSEVEEKTEPQVTKKIRKKRRNEFTDLSQTDQSENDTKIGRPMRKTKEAATIYMELIGQKLNFSDFDDDNFSMDSFPELPNVRKTEQMENEHRANLDKDKADATSTPKRNKLKKEEKISFLGVSAEPKVKSVKEKQETKNIKECNNVSMKNASASEKPIQAVLSKAAPVKKDPKLQKSFSDSDDEPLATKFEKKVVTSPKKKRKSITDVSRMEMVAAQKADPLPAKIEVKNEIKEIVSINDLNSVKLETPKIEPIKAKPSAETLSVLSKPTTPKSIDLNETEFKMPAESVTQLLSPPINVSPIKPCGTRENFSNKIKSPTTPTKESIPSSPSAKNSTQSISAILADLMPSKEESGKIFGIASVTLAQSSGPNDTKCTLGKCGSVHKPPLGPVVPTESYLSEQLTSKERRKAKVNMTREQIEKWLVECSLNADPFECDSLDDELDLNNPLKPVNYLSTPSPFRDRDSTKEGSPSTTKHKTILPKEKQTSVTTPKGSSVKNRSTISKDSNKIEEKDSSQTKSGTNDSQIISESNSKTKPFVVSDEVQIVLTDPTAANEIKRTIENLSQEINAKVSNEISQTPVAKKTSPESLSLTKTPSSTPDKKPIYNRRTPVYSTKKAEQSNAKNSSVVNTFGAFSPENEASIYSFDKEEDITPASIPFRRHSRRSTHSRTDEIDKKNKKDASSTDPSPSSKKQRISLTLSPEDNKKSAAIAVKADSVAKALLKSHKIAKGKIAAPADNDSKDSDSEGHTFYIPLQCMGSLGGSADQLIQGVAVKLGTEGPEGPNQKVIMHAKLVTKSQMGSNTTPIPEGMANVQEIVKSLIANKEAGLKSVPIGTVQPRFKTNDTVVASTSTANVTQSQRETEQQIQSLVVDSLTRQNSNQSIASQKTKTPKRCKLEQIIQPSNNTAFPRHDDPAQMVEAPVFKPTEKEFQDPLEFINRIAPIAARFGLCRIIPPANFKPECKISDDMRFTAYNQYVHKMLHRWGPSAKELNAIKKYLATQSITLNQPPLIGGMEVDLPRLYHTVQESGGLKEVIEKKKWARVAEEMCIPKAAQDRVTKLDDIYCKYLLPYDTLSPTERQKLFDEVEADWAKREAKARRNADRSGQSDSNSNDNSGSEDESDDDDDESGDNGSMECIVKGKSMPLSAFFRVARNTMALWFKNTEPTSNEIESEFWRHVAVRDSHVCVHSGSIDSSGWGYGFPSPGPKTKNSTCSKHPWNLKVLTNNHNSILRSIGPVTGVTVPTLHVGMLFSACCWYRDPHGLPWIEYLHTGGSKVWYSVPNEQSSNFRAAFTSLVPTHCQNKTVWLPCDTAMVPPHMLTDRGVSLCRTEQEPGQFVIVFPRAYTSNLCTGYSISESVYFASMSWLDTAKEDFQDIHDSCEPAMFSLEQLLFSVVADARTNIETLESVLPMMNEVFSRESKDRAEIKAAGVTRTEKNVLKAKKPQAEENECDICRANLYISWIRTDDDNIYCLQHAVKYLTADRIQAKQCKLLYMYKIEEINEMIKKITAKLSQHKKKTDTKK